MVLDTSAFVAGFDPFSVGREHYTVPTVREELIEKSISRVRLDIAVSSRRLKIRRPRKAFIDNAKAFATSVGDIGSLSQTDLQLLAVALELKSEGVQPLVVTDDYSIQNVANRMDIEFASLLTFGIRHQWQWLRYCPACHKEYSSERRIKTCEVCGTDLKRKPLRKSSLDHSRISEI